MTAPDKYLTNSDILDLGNEALPKLRTTIGLGRYRVILETGGYCWFHDPPTNHPHLHENLHELCLVLRGRGEYRHGTERVELSPGMVFMSGLNVVHEISSFATRDLFLVFFILQIQATEEPLSPQYEDRLVEAFQRECQTTASGQDHLRHYLPALRDRATDARGAFRAESTLRLLVFDMLAALLPTPPLTHSDRRPETQIERACRFIRQRVGQRTTVEEVANAAFCSPRHLRRLFRERLNKTIVEEIHETKLNFARRQLLMQFSVEEVARAIGIDNAPQFSRLFKSAYGISPKAWQTTHAPREAIPRTIHPG